MKTLLKNIPQTISKSKNIIFLLILTFSFSLLFSISLGLTGVYASDDDFDNDGIDNGYPDNCVFTYNPNQLNTDYDRLGDVCDPNNYAPVISGIIRNSDAITVGEEFVMQIYVDIGGNDNPSNILPFENLVIDVVNKPEGASVSSQVFYSGGEYPDSEYMAVMRWTPSESDIGEYRFLIQVEDGDYNALRGTARGHEGQLHTNYRPQDHDMVFITAITPEEASVVVEDDNEGSGDNGWYGYIENFVRYVTFFMHDDEDNENNDDIPNDEIPNEDVPDEDEVENDYHPEEYIPEDDEDEHTGGRLEREEDILIDSSVSVPVHESETSEDSEERASGIRWYKFNMINDDSLKSGDDAYILLDFANIGEEKLDYARITVTIPELSIYRDYKFNNIKPDKSANIIAVLPIPKTANLGEYTVKAEITAYSNSKYIHKVKYRTFILN